MQQYPNLSNETDYFTGKRYPWNKSPKEKINQTLELYSSGLTKTKDIAEKLGISVIKVQRILKENNLGEIGHGGIFTLLFSLVLTIITLIPLFSFIYQFFMKNKSEEFKRKYYIFFVILNSFLSIAYILSYFFVLKNITM